MTVRDPQAALLALASARGDSLAALSAMLGRNAAYLQQFVTRGSPRRLAERDRRLLADYFGVDETRLGGPHADDRVIRIERMDVGASAGPGTLVDDAVVLGTETIERGLARRLGLVEGQAAIIRVRGDSMAPGLLAGDQIVVDETDRQPRGDGGIFVIRINDAVLVKRVARRGSRLVVTSDNPAASPVEQGDVVVLGRVVWQMRRPR